MNLDEIKQRLAAATPGPWTACGDERGGCDCGMVFSEPADCHAATAQALMGTDTRNEEGMPYEPIGLIGSSMGGYPGDLQRKANAALIAHAPQDLADLIAEVERLRAGVPYRPGLPSVEQVRAHEARGGWWMVRRENFPHVALRRWVVRKGAIFDVEVGDTEVGLEVATLISGALCRPCTAAADGTPCEWAEASAVCS